MALRRRQGHAAAERPFLCQDPVASAACNVESPSIVIRHGAWPLGNTAAGLAAAGVENAWMADVKKEGREAGCPENVPAASSTDSVNVNQGACPHPSGRNGLLAACSLLVIVLSQPTRSRKHSVGDGEG